METVLFKTNKVLLTIIHCFSPLLIGGLLYILFRSTDLRMFKWFSTIGLYNFIHGTRKEIIEFKNHLPQWLFYSLPDGLWVYSFTSALLILWDGKLTIWVLIPLFTGAFVEIAQAFKIFPGTFDILDLIFTVTALLLSFYIINPKFKQNEKAIS